MKQGDNDHDHETNEFHLKYMRTDDETSGHLLQIKKISHSLELLQPPIIV